MGATPSAARVRQTNVTCTACEHESGECSKHRLSVYKQASPAMYKQAPHAGTGKPALFFEGGQTPFWKMLPKRGFKNRFRSVYDNVLLAEVEAAVRSGTLDPTRVITVKHLYDAGLLEKKAYNRDGVQVLPDIPHISSEGKTSTDGPHCVLLCSSVHG